MDARNTLLLMIYEINHIWTAEMKLKWRNDRRSERNLCSCVKKPEKKFQDFNGVWIRDLAITGAMLYQLSYNAEYWNKRTSKLQFISRQTTGDKMWTICGSHNWPWPVFNYFTFSMFAWFKSRIVPTTFCRLIKVINILENYSWSYIQATSNLTGL